MSKKNLISVIVPVYNVDKNDFECCVNSIINQSYNNLEIILVDDGSKDDIAKFCDDMDNIDSRIKVYHKTNGGVSSARNLGIKKSTGEYLSFIDSDDILDKDMYKVLITNIRESNSDISCSGYSYVELDGKEYEKYGTGKKNIFNVNEALKEFFNDNSFGVAVWNKLFRKKSISSLEFNETLKINEDRLFLYNSIMKSKSIVYEDKCLYKYIKRENSATTKKFNKNRFDVLKVNNMIEKDLFNSKLNNTNLLSLWNKNKMIYLIRLYRELVLSKMTKEYESQKLDIIKELKSIYSNNILKKLNKFDRIEVILIVKCNVLYPLFISLLIKLKFLKKIKNISERKSR